MVGSCCGDLCSSSFVDCIRVISPKQSWQVAASYILRRLPRLSQRDNAVATSRLLHSTGGHMRIPVFGEPSSIPSLAEELLLHGIVVVDTMRTHAQRLANELREELGIGPVDSEQEDAKFLLHLSCEVETESADRWFDYYIHGETCPVDALDVKALVCTAVRQWDMARRPDYFVAKVPPGR